MVIERSAGALIIIMMILLVIAISTGAARVGLDTRSEYFYGDGPESWRVVAEVHRDELTDGLLPLALAGVSAVSPDLCLATRPTPPRSNRGDHLR